MTTVAYKAGVMACDSRWTCGDWLATSRTKIITTKYGFLAGFSGDVDTRDLEEMIDRIKGPNYLPSRQVLANLDMDARALVIFGPNDIYTFDCSSARDKDPSAVVRISFPFYAIGSGGIVARIAMECGRSAREAVALACKYDGYSSLPIHSLSFEKAPCARRSKRVLKK